MCCFLHQNLVLVTVMLGTTVLMPANGIATETIGLSRDITVEIEKLKVNQQLIAQAKTDENNVLEQVNNYSSDNNQNSMSQVTSVSQFSDVQPTDWAFQALQFLVERLVR